jgi:Asp-tRNA(Asn)/Glu-tRNA(Gln) amidotransferase A subunit family amidase
LALGTQTGGSVIRPAAFCGIVGFKPTYGRIATDGIIPHAASVDTIGMFTQDVAGSVIAASLLCCGWKNTTATNVPVLAVPSGPYLAQASSEALMYFERHLMRLEKAGYTIKHVAAFNDIEAIKMKYRHLTSAEMAQVHENWLATYALLYRPRTVEKICAGRSVSREQVVQARHSSDTLRAQLEAVMRQEGIDLWVCPAAVGPAPEGLTRTGDTAMNVPWSYVGMPALSLPAGTAANGLPLGLQVVAKTWDDEQLLAWAEPMAGALIEHI